jgi:dolichyl-diphosphooligosaccharide--protein glycosyltransferase
MQFTAVYIKRYILDSWSLNDVCCYVPCWFGAIASVLVGLLTYECTIPENSSSNLLTWVIDLIQGNKYDDDDEKIHQQHKQQHRSVALGLFSPALECGVCAMGMMAIVPAHLMRSVGGGYDNESIANTAMLLTFYFWVRSLRNRHGWVPLLDWHTFIW